MDTKGPVKDATTTAKQSVESDAEQFEDVANQTTRDVSALGGNVQRAVDVSLADHPYTTLAMMAAIGFVIGAIWKS